MTMTLLGTDHGPGAEGDPDERLVREWVESADPAVFARLVDQHQPYVRHLASRVLGPAQEAEIDDVLQEVFARVATALRDFRGDSLFRTWLHRLTLNCALDRRRGMRWRAIHVDISVLEREASEHHRDSPYQHVEATERQRVVHECLQDLPEMVRDLIHLHYWQDLSVEQIAARLQRPAATVRSCLYRGRRVLYRTLAGRGFDRTALSTSTSLRRKGGPRPGRRLPERATVAEAVG